MQIGQNFSTKLFALVVLESETGLTL